MGSKLVRRLGAHCAMVAMLFGQFAVVAYACPVQGPAGLAAMPHVAMHMDGDAPCTGMAPPPASPQANACEVHCTDGVTLPAQPDLPQVALVALPAQAIEPGQLAHSAEAARTPYAALPGAPPLILQYCRLLI